MPSQSAKRTEGLVPVAVAARGPATVEDVEGVADRYGKYNRPTPWALDTLEWESAGFQPRWLGQDSSDCAVSFDPSIVSSRGGDELQRFTEGLKAHSDVGIIIWTTGLNDNPELTGYTNVFGGGDSVWTSIHTSVSCKRLPTGVQPIVADDLTPPDRNLALRLRNDPKISRWWALDLHANHVEGPGGPARVSNSPVPHLAPLLLDSTGAVLAGVAEVDSQRWYFVPRGADSTSLLRWLMHQALPVWAPDALRAARRSTAIDKDLQTPIERSLRADLAELESTYARRREQLEAELSRATEAADAVRSGLLYGRADELEDAVARALRTAGLQVRSLDVLLGDTKSADLLVEHAGKRWLVEVKSANGAASESLVGALLRHLETWPQLRADLPVAGGVLIVSHHLAASPNARPEDIYNRPEFVNSLTVPVISARTLFDQWRDQDLAALRAVFS